MATRGQDSHYAVLGVSPSASAAQITTAFRKLVRTLHPDVRPDGDPDRRDRLDLVLAAYDVLRDPQRRAEYDARRKATAARPPRTEPRRFEREEPPAYGRPAVVVLGAGLRPPLRGAFVRAGPVRVRPYTE
ncbi:J domain-containing protein [Streptomyces sp. NPDC015127]|uniref:J domain-containing protein n=1 Tax=Streptomyces sp. NPDC015127 TaxID=3364939 RepID=UPI0036FFE002